MHMLPGIKLLRVSLVLLVLTLVAGCGGSLTFKIWADPNPIVLQQGDQTAETTLHIQTKGYGFIDITGYTYEVYSANDTKVFTGSKQFQDPISIPAVSSLVHVTRDISMDISYTQATAVKSVKLTLDSQDISASTTIEIRTQ